jgi:phosphoglucomutase
LILKIYHSQSHIKNHFETQISGKPLVTVADVLAEHWSTYGRNIYARYDWEEVDGDKARGFMKDLDEKMRAWPGQTTINVGGKEVREVGGT